jgi:hypothetical protein
MATEPKVIGTWRNKDGLNLRIVAVPTRASWVEYILERRMDGDKDAMGAERWQREDLDDDSGRAYDLLRWLGQKLEVGK